MSKRTLTEDVKQNKFRKLEQREMIYQDTKGRYVCVCPPSENKKDSMFKTLNKGWLIDDLPIRISIIGKTGKGKTTLVKDILKHNVPAIDFDFDNFVGFSSSGDMSLPTRDIEEIESMEDTFPDFYNLLNDKGIARKEHSVAVLDDVPKYFCKDYKKAYRSINDLCTKGRRRGWSIVYCGHEGSYMNKENSGAIGSQMDMFVYPTSQAKQVNRDLKNCHLLDDDLIKKTKEVNVEHLWNCVHVPMRMCGLLYRGKDPEILQQYSLVGDIYGNDINDL